MAIIGEKNSDHKQITIGWVLNFQYAQTPIHRARILPGSIPHKKCRTTQKEQQQKTTCIAKDVEWNMTGECPCLRLVYQFNSNCLIITGMFIDKRVRGVFYRRCTTGQSQLKTISLGLFVTVPTWNTNLSLQSNPTWIHSQQAPESIKNLSSTSQDNLHNQLVLNTVS